LTGGEDGGVSHRVHEQGNCRHPGPGGRRKESHLFERKAAGAFAQQSSDLTKKADFTPKQSKVEFPFSLPSGSAEIGQNHQALMAPSGSFSGRFLSDSGR
jgi:hypothetical protein